MINLYNTIPQNVPNHDDFLDIIRDCIEMPDENIDVLSDIQYSIDTNQEDMVIPEVNKTQLIDMVHEVTDSLRIKKAESDFMRRNLETDEGL